MEGDRNTAAWCVMAEHDLRLIVSEHNKQSKAKQKKQKKGAGFRASMSLFYMRINQVPKYIIYSYIMLLLLPIPVNSAL